MAASPPIQIPTILNEKIIELSGACEVFFSRVFSRNLKTIKDTDDLVPELHANADDLFLGLLPAL